MYVYLFVYVWICSYVCMYVCIYVYLYLCIYVHTYICTNVCSLCLSAHSVTFVGCTSVSCRSVLLFPVARFFCFLSLVASLFLFAFVFVRYLLLHCNISPLHQTNARAIRNNKTRGRLHVAFLAPCFFELH